MNLHCKRTWGALELRRWELALSAAHSGLLESPKNADLHAIAAVSYLELGDLNAALQSAGKVVEIEPGVDRGHRLPMEAFRRQGNAAVNQKQGKTAHICFQRAIEAGHEVLRINPHSIAALTSLSSIAAAVGGADQSNRLAMLAMEANPDNVASAHVFGRVLVKQGNTDAAEATFRKAISLPPETAQLHLELADIHFNRQEFRRAYEAVQNALRLDPNNILAHQLHERVIQTQSSAVRSLLRANAWLLWSRTLRGGLVIAWFLLCILGVAWTGAWLPPGFDLVWVVFLVLGIVGCVMLHRAPAMLSRWVWCFAVRTGSRAALLDPDSPRISRPAAPGERTADG